MRKFLFLSSVLIASSYTPALHAEDKIVVTAERRTQTVNDVPFSITPLDVTSLATRASEHPAEVLNLAPGTTLHRGSGQEHLTAIRSPILTAGAGAGSFLFLENGVPLRAAGFANINGLFEAQSFLADRMEVVRGPGGAFYGANAIHGAVNVLTPTPEENSNTAQISASEDIRQGFAAIARQNRGKGFYAGVALQDDTGFRADSGADKQQLTLRYTDDTGPWTRDTILTATNLNQETAGFIRGVDAFEDEELRETNPNPEAYRDVKSLRLQSSFTREAVEGSFSITPYARWTDMEFLQHFLPSQAIEENGHWSLGVQSAWVSGENAPFAYAVGLDAEYTEGFLTEVQEIPTIFSFTQGDHYDYDITATSLSPFARADVALDATTTLQIAARVDWTRYDYTNNLDTNTPADPGRFLRPANRDDDFLTVSPKVSLQRQFENGTGWVGYSEGARPPQTTDLYRLQDNQVVDEVDPERIRNIEAGWRGALAENVSAEVVAYYAEKENFLFRDADGFNVVDGETRHTGVEFALSAVLSEKLMLDVNGTYAAHTYQFDRPVNSTANPTEAISKGDDIDTAPRTLGGARLTWTPVPDVTTQLQWVHMGDYYTDASNSNTYDGHDIFHLRAEKTFGFFTGFATVRNLLDERYAERADFAFGSERYFPDHGRTLTIGLRYQN